MDLRIRDRVAVVTGGSSGIGLATVRQFLLEGAQVLSCGRDADRLNQSVASLAADGINVSMLVTQACDVLDERAVAELAQTAQDRFGRVDMLVNNAGQGRLGTFATTLDADWEDELSLKFFSVIRPTRAFLQLLRASDAGSILVVNSLLARQPEPHMVCTSAARAGVQNLVKSLSIELAPAIRVNSILLGTVNSGQWQRRYAERAKPDQSMASWLAELAREKQIPLGRMGEADEPAAAILFLSSPISGFTTGATLEVAGGVSRFA